VTKQRERYVLVTVHQAVFSLMACKCNLLWPVWYMLLYRFLIYVGFTWTWRKMSENSSPNIQSSHLPESSHWKIFSIFLLCYHLCIFSWQKNQSFVTWNNKLHVRLSFFACLFCCCGISFYWLVSCSLTARIPFYWLVSCSLTARIPLLRAFSLTFQYHVLSY
jgi:hypothetical protein